MKSSNPSPTQFSHPKDPVPATGADRSFLSKPGNPKALQENVSFFKHPRPAEEQQQMPQGSPQGSPQTSCSCSSPRDLQTTSKTTRLQGQGIQNCCPNCLILCFSALLNKVSTLQAVSTVKEKKFAQFLITGLSSGASVEKQVGLYFHYNL